MLNYYFKGYRLIDNKGASVFKSAHLTQYLRVEKDIMAHNKTETFLTQS